MMEDQVRRACLQAIASWQNAESECEAVHPECAFMVKTKNDQDFVSFLRGQLPTEPFSTTMAETTDSTVNISNINVPPVGQQSAASVKVSIGPSPPLSSSSSSSRPRLVGFLVLLRSNTSEQQQQRWKVISVTLEPEQSRPVLPEHFAAVSHLTWDGYCRASRSCDGDAMARVFHRTCRLTYSYRGDVQIVHQPRFCEMVTTRYTDTQLPHRPFAHLLDSKEHVHLLGACDSLQDIDFVTPDMALVTLRVGHPPFLWTDLLTCARLASGHDNGTGGGGTDGGTSDGRWWIVHKSSENVPFLLEHAAAATTTIR